MYEYNVYPLALNYHVWEISSKIADFIGLSKSVDVSKSVSSNKWPKLRVDYLSILVPIILEPNYFRVKHPYDLGGHFLQAN